MFLPPAVSNNTAPPTHWQPQPPQQAQPQSQPEINPQTSRRIQFLHGLSKWSAYGFWFSIGILAANITRFLPHGWVLYVTIKLSVGGYLLFIKPDNATAEVLSLRRISGLALVISVISFWDAVAVIATLPVTIGIWIFPLWLCVVMTVLFIIMAGFVVILNQTRV